MTDGPGRSTDPRQSWSKALALLVVFIFAMVAVLIFGGYNHAVVTAAVAATGMAAADLVRRLWEATSTRPGDDNDQKTGCD